MQETQSDAEKSLATSLSLDSENTQAGPEAFLKNLEIFTLKEEVQLYEPNYLLTEFDPKTGERSYLDPSFSEIVGLDLDERDYLRKGERVALIPQELVPSMPGTISVFPIDWHARELEKFKKTGKMPTVLMFLAIPKLSIGVEREAPLVLGESTSEQQTKPIKEKSMPGGLRDKMISKLKKIFAR